MASEPVRRPGVAWGVQGCLVGAVVLFVLLMIGLLLIAYQQVRTPPESAAPRPLGEVAPRPPAENREASPLVQPDPTLYASSLLHRRA